MEPLVGLPLNDAPDAIVQKFKSGGHDQENSQPPTLGSCEREQGPIRTCIAITMLQGLTTVFQYLEGSGINPDRTSELILHAPHYSQSSGLSEIM